MKILTTFANKGAKMANQPIFQVNVKDAAPRFINLLHICSVGEAECNKSRDNDYVEIEMSSGSKYVVNLYEICEAFKVSGTPKFFSLPNK